MGCKPQNNCTAILSVHTDFFDKNVKQTIADSVEVKAVDVQINYKIEEGYFHCKNETHYSFFNTANATKLNINVYNFYTIKSITITSNNDFDAAHPAGTSLNDVFDIPSIDSLNYKHGIYNQPQYIFTLVASPSTEVYHQFKISTVIQSTDMPLVDSSNVFKLKI